MSVLELRQHVVFVTKRQQFCGYPAPSAMQDDRPPFARNARIVATVRTLVVGVPFKPEKSLQRKHIWAGKCTKSDALATKRFPRLLPSQYSCR